MSGAAKLKSTVPATEGRDAVVNAIKARPDLEIEISKYRHSRFFAIYLNGELLAVTVYKKGALAIRAALLRR